MRILAIVVAGVCSFTPSLVHAEKTAVELQAHGEELAQAGRFVEAIDAFKAADRLDIRASHACLIALAYTRRELWPQAEVWLAMCHERANAGDPLPEWVAEADKQIAERLGAANVAEVEITVEPAVEAKITVSSFAPDETFAPPRKIHLPPGHHVIIVKAAGYQDGTRALDLTDKTAQHIAITLVPWAKVPGTVGARSNLRHKLFVYGAIAGGAGAVTYAIMGVSYLKLHGGTGFGGGYETAYDVTRPVTIGLWGVAAGLVIAGLVMRGHDEERPTVSAAPIAGGGMVSVGWQR